MTEIQETAKALAVWAFALLGFAVTVAVVPLLIAWAVWRLKR